jgi:hypothetical protein
VLILDTNIIIQQIDALEYKWDMPHIIILQTVMKEVQHLNLSIFRRLCALINDETKLFIFFPNETISATKCLR